MRKIISLLSTNGKHLALLTIIIFIIKPTRIDKDKQLLLAVKNFPIRTYLDKCGVKCGDLYSIFFFFITRIYLYCKYLDIS